MRLRDRTERRREHLDGPLPTPGVHPGVVDSRE